jgi:hypothetical protein
MTKEINVVSSLAFAQSKLFIFSSTSHISLVISFVVSEFTLLGFNGVENDAFPSVHHGTAKEDKGKELTLESFKSPPPVDAEDMKVSPLHVIFNLKGVIIGKEYFKIIHLLPPSFNLAQGPTLLNKSVVPKLTLKEFLLKCLK